MLMPYHQLGRADHWDGSYENQIADHAWLLGHIEKGLGVPAEASDVGPEDIELPGDSPERASWNLGPTKKQTHKFVKTNLLIASCSAWDNEDPDDSPEKDRLLSQKTLCWQSISRQPQQKKRMGWYPKKRCFGILTKVSNSSIVKNEEGSRLPSTLEHAVR